MKHAGSIASCFSSYTRTIVVQEQNVLDALRRVIDPATKRDIVSLGAVQNLTVREGRIQFELDLFTNGHPDSSTVEAQCRNALKQLSWHKDVCVRTPVRKPISSFAALGSGLAHVEHIIAVSSCKGGVGKSTIALNLALALTSWGARVALLDADVYGPSLPTLIQPKDVAVRRSKLNAKFVEPIDYEGLRLLSFGYVNPNSGAPGAGAQTAAMLRGPIATRVINQLVHNTEWGDIDYMVLDLPPGTGDVVLTVCQSMPVTAAVIVTTPSRLSIADVVKGAHMFKEMKVPTLAVVENMKYFQCPGGAKHYVFGKSGGFRLIPNSNEDGFEIETRTNAEDQFGSEGVYEIPLSTLVSLCNESADPIVKAHPHSEEAQVYRALAADTIRRVVRLKYNARTAPVVTLDVKRGLVLRYFTDKGAEEYVISSAELRRRDPLSGALRSDKYALDPSVTAVHLDVKGNYGVAVLWSDGHFADIYPFDVLKRIAELKPTHTEL